jgi:hydrogenase expression/formation protein HypC
VTPPEFTPECHEDVCVTCTDAAVPARIVELCEGGLALAEFAPGAEAEEISVALVKARVGDVVLVHAKEAIVVLEPDKDAYGRPGA